jgi:transcription termination/antitermination protein NusG
MTNESSIPQWFAAHVRCHHEKTTAEHMRGRSIEHFLPTYETVRRWKDRQKQLSLPLFPGYMFVRVTLDQRLSVLVVPGVARLVGSENRPVPITDAEIERLKTLRQHRINVEPHAYLAVAQRVRIVRGPLIGLEGVLLRRKGRVRLLISIDLIRQSALIEIDSADVEPILGLAHQIVPRQS